MSIERPEAEDGADARLDALVRAAAPRAPARLAPRVTARVRAARLRRRVRFGAVMLTLAAAAVILVVVKERGREPTSGWSVVATRGVDSPSPTPVSAGARFTVGADEQVSLVRPGGGRVSLRPTSEVVAEPSALRLERGPVELEGDGASVETRVARVTALGSEARVELDLYAKDRAGEAAQPGAAAPRTTALMSVVVARGQAAVTMPAPAGTADQLALAEGDRALLGTGVPAIVLRAAPPPAPQPLPAPTGAEAIETAEHGPALNRDTIRSAIRALKPAFLTCYEEALKRQSGLAVRLNVRFAIAAAGPAGDEGRMQELEVLPGEGVAELPADFAECLLGALGTMRFPAPAGGGVVRVTYPLSFATDASQPASAPARPEAP